MQREEPSPPDFSHRNSLHTCILLVKETHLCGNLCFKKKIMYRRGWLKQNDVPRVAVLVTVPYF